MDLLDQTNSYLLVVAALALDHGDDGSDTSDVSDFEDVKDMPWQAGELCFLPSAPQASPKWVAAPQAEKIWWPTSWEGEGRERESRANPELRLRLRTRCSRPP